ncbi:MAG: hypothetical protein WAX69_16570 [Victivallales bacterium]
MKQLFQVIFKEHVNKVTWLHIISSSSRVTLLTRSHLKDFRLALFSFCLLFSSMILSAAEIKYDSPQTFYAGKETVISIKTDGLNGKNLSWNLKYSGRTIAAAELAIPESGSLELKFTFPEIKDGVSGAAELVCRVGESKLQKNIFFFSPNPFSQKKKIFENMKIGLWSPEGDDSARKLLGSLGVATTDVANFADFKGELLIVCGIDLGNFPGLEKELVNICSSGSSILIINPAGGILPLKTESFRNMIFSRNEKIMDFDKKLDSDKWGDAFPNEKSLNLVPSDNGVAVVVADNRTGFTFMSAKIGKGELVICTWDIFGKIEKSPTPVYLLEKMMSESEKRRTGEPEKELKN